MMEASGATVRAELGEGIQAACRMNKEKDKDKDKERPATENKEQEAASSKGTAKADLSSLGSMLQARWKSGAPASEAKPEARAGQIRKFRIVKLDPATKKIEVEIA
jgi:small subunit ribosomal protein S1